jgi:hypothetical protein
LVVEMMLNSAQRVAFAVKLRRLSTPAGKIQRTPEQIKEGLEKVQKFRKLQQPTTKPQSLTVAMGTRKELHIPQNITEMAALSGMPSEQAKRTVIISPRMLKTLQSGQRLANQWQIKWKNMERWSNPLMGWTSTSDPMSNVKLNFDTKDEAIAFAKRNGWKFEVLGDTSKATVEPGTYLYKHNFLDKKTAAYVKRDGHKTKIFELPGFGKSNFFMPLKYHGDGEVAQHGPAVKK